MEENESVKNKHKKKRVMDILKAKLTNEMFHSILDAIETPYWSLKIFLICFCLLANALASYTTLTLILSYLEYSVTTTSRLISDSSVEFPKVTICNTNPFQTKYAFDLLTKINKQFNANTSLFDGFLLKNINYKEKRERFGTFKTFAMSLISNFLNEEKQKIGHRLEDILLSCRFNFKGMLFCLILSYLNDLF